ncbi:MAG: acyl-ACP--UDP-N-acetylglucosamine O-acyltransferase [Candidatus Omnitrophica bacterium]|nr:acyl-ACP--UDP-N-acetylglucosamine O-acyltransferase [Candidatus Omnitrophota bacterium]
MSKIHPSAQVAKGAILGKDNEIGPGVIIEDKVTLDSKNKIWANAYICRGTTIGSNNQIHMGAIIGHEPQDLAYKGQETFTKIGDRNIIREYVTIHRGTKEGTSTVIGDDNFLMANAHVAHNCVIENKVIMVNLASLTGYCVAESGAFLSGMTGFHQFTRIGRLAIVSALSVTNRDIPPYAICGGRPSYVLGINVVGLRRAGVPSGERDNIKRAFKLLYRSGLNVSQALESIENELDGPYVAHLIQFIRSAKRGICNYKGEVEETLLPKNPTGFKQDNSEKSESGYSL